MENKKTLIVNYFGMGTGGIEKYTADLMKYAISCGYRVIWFTMKETLDNAVQPGITDNEKIEKVLFLAGRRKFFKKPTPFRINEDEDVVMISFVPEDYVWAEQFRYKYKCHTFYHHLILMNFFGWLTYPEDEFKFKLLAKQRAKLSNKIAHELDDNNNIRAFSRIHLVKFKERYDLNFDVSDDLLLKDISVNEAVSVDDLYKKAKSRREEFIIVSCSRFQFPHKGYQIGLLSVFSELKKKYPYVKLVVVGDGGEREYYNTFYDKLDDDVKSSIEFKGRVPFEEVLDIYKNCHLSIGLAGALSASASVGIPSLLVRHDTLECETYGLYQDNDSTLRSDPGVDPLPIIEKIMNMPDDEYVEIGVEGRESYLARTVVEADYILKETNRTSNPSVSKTDMRNNKMWAIISLLKKHMKL